jgi:hypothetical protein
LNRAGAADESQGMNRAIQIVLSVVSTGLCAIACATDGSRSTPSPAAMGDDTATKDAAQAALELSWAAKDVPAPAEAPKAGSVVRVGGDLKVESNLDGETWRSGRCLIEAPLPEGYPAPTPPGAIELKTYPIVRRAEVSARGSTMVGSNFAFWPLFNHIKSRDIAMTSPVEMDYRGMEADGNPYQLDESKGEWTMSFLYRQREQGPEGKDGRVVVRDNAQVTVLSVGVMGPYGIGRVNEGLPMLEAWLKAHPEWERAGDVRAFSYNGPQVRNATKWSEVQLPVKRVAQPASDPSSTK